MIKKSGSKTSIVSNTSVPRLDLLKKEGTREKVQSERQPVTSTPKHRKKAEKTIEFSIESPKPNTDRKTKRTSSKPPTKLLRQKSEATIDTIETPKNNKKEKPSKPLEHQKSSKSLFSRNKKAAPTIQSAAKAVQAQTTPVKLPTPPTGASNCCRNMLLIFKEEQYKSLKEPLKTYCHDRKIQVDEQHDFLQAIAGYSNDRLPTKREAEQLLDTFGPNGDKALNIDDEPFWHQVRTAVEEDDMQTFFDKVMGGDNERAGEESDAILPRLAFGLDKKYADFVKAHS